MSLKRTTVVSNNPITPNNHPNKKQRTGPLESKKVLTKSLAEIPLDKTVEMVIDDFNTTILWAGNSERQLTQEEFDALVKSGWSGILGSKEICIRACKQGDNSGREFIVADMGEDKNGFMTFLDTVTRKVSWWPSNKKKDAQNVVVVKKTAPLPSADTVQIEKMLAQFLDELKNENWSMKAWVMEQLAGLSPTAPSEDVNEQVD